MRWKACAVGLVALNVAQAAISLGAHRVVHAEDVPAVLRGRALELVDDRGRVRAEIKVLPAQPTLRSPDGTLGYPETVQLRLIDSKGGPNVKLAALEDGSGLVLGGEGSYTQVLSRGERPLIRIVDKDGTDRVLRARARR